MFWFDYMVWEERHRVSSSLIFIKTSRSLARFTGPKKVHCQKSALAKKKSTRVIWGPIAFVEVRNRQVTCICKHKPLLKAAPCLGHAAPTQPWINLALPSVQQWPAGLPRWGSNCGDHTHNMSLLKGCTVSRVAPSCMGLC